MSRHRPLIHKALARRMIASIGAKEILPHLVPLFLPVCLQRLAVFIDLLGAMLFLVFRHQ